MRYINSGLIFGFILSSTKYNEQRGIQLFLRFSRLRRRVSITEIPREPFLKIAGPFGNWSMIARMPEP
jgi:hypothetical protein